MVEKGKNDSTEVEHCRSTVLEGLIDKWTMVMESMAKAVGTDVW